MNEDELRKLSEDGLSIYDISKKYQKGYSTIRYWLLKFNIKTKEGKSREINKNKNDDDVICSSCKKLKKISDFYKMGGSRSRGYCKKCLSKYHQDRVRKVKIKMVLYKGGECEICNLKLENSHYSVFDFHHIDPSSKDPNFNKIKFQKWSKIKSEIDKCKLLCSNCHRIIHAELCSSFIMSDVLIKMNNKSGRSVWVEKNEKENIKKCECGKEINKKSNKCEDCYHKNNRKVTWPDYNILLEDVKNLGYNGCGLKYCVTGNTIKRWIKYYEKLK